MQHISLEPYVERVYGYAMQRTFSRSEAEELTQEILLTLLAELPRLRDEERFEPFLWGVARRVTLRFRRRESRRRQQLSLDDLSAFPAPEDDDSREYAALRRQVATLSAQWRDILVLHYFDGLSTREIASRLSLPEGTVTWRLSQARKRLKEEYDMNETALRPQKLLIGFSGSDASTPPHEYINDALSQNLLILCRETPQTVETLSAHTGVPAYYIEDKLAELVRREAMSEPARGRFRTEILIYTPADAACTRHQRALFTPLAADFAKALRNLAEDVSALRHYTAGRSHHDLIWLYGVMAMEHLADTQNPIPSAPHPLRFDGGRWSCHGYLAAPGMKYHYSLRRLCCWNLGSRGTYAHQSYGFGSIICREMMFDSQINVCEDILTGAPVEDADAAASAIRGGYIRRDADGALTVDIPAFTREQHCAFRRMAEEAFADTLPRYQAALRQFAAGYKRCFPAHMGEAVQRQCAYTFLSAFADPVQEEIVRLGLLPPPTKGSHCDVLVQFK